MLSLQELEKEWPELIDYFKGMPVFQDSRLVLKTILDELDIDDIQIYYPYEQLVEEDVRDSNKLRQWFITDPNEIPSVRVFQALTSNANAYARYSKLVEKRDKDNLLTIDTLQDLVYEAFKFKFSKRLINLKDEQNQQLRYLYFSTKYPVTLRFECTQDQLIDRLLDTYGFEINQIIIEKDFDGLKEIIDTLLPAEDDNFNKTILRLFKSTILWELRKIPRVLNAYFDSETTSFFFFEQFEDLLMDAVSEAESEMIRSQETN